MKEHVFEQYIVELYLYFQRKSLPGSKIIKKWQDKTKDVPDAALPFISEKFEDLDSLPRNIPKVFKKFYWQYVRANKITNIVYDEYDDPRFPIEKLQEAFELLFASKETKFEDYCTSQKMPSQDIERVKNKCKMVRERQLQDSETKISEMADDATRAIDWQPPPPEETKPQIDFFNVEI